MTGACLLIVEGPDGGGKTTLCKHLAKTKGWMVRHEGPPPAGKPAMHYYYRRLYAAMMNLARGASGVALDRFALGELVYGPILRGRSRVTRVEWDAMRAEMDGFGIAQRVLCLPPFKTCLNAWVNKRAAGHEMVRDVDTFAATYDAWVALRDEPGQFVYDWTLPGALADLEGRLAP